MPEALCATEAFPTLRNLRLVPSIGFSGSAPFPHSQNRILYHSPCIIFIDELDAIGRQRGVAVRAVNDEREQTLNALLVELDGFEPNTGVILLAATNRREVLDRALL